MKRSLTLSEADIEAIAQRTAQVVIQILNEQKTKVGDRVPEGFLPSRIAILYLPIYGVPVDADPSVVQATYRNEMEKLRADIRAGEYKSGREVQKKGRLWAVNVRAYLARKEREQSKCKVC